MNTTDNNRSILSNHIASSLRILVKPATDELVSAAYHLRHNLHPMKKEQIVKASLMAGLITQTIHTQPSTWESDTLVAWTEEHPDNQLLMEELTDSDSLNQLLHDFYKFKPEMRLKKINQRIFGNTKDLTNC